MSIVLSDDITLSMIKNGQNGKSAYQIWLDAGNEGSEEDYLNSLKGANGQNGQNAVIYTLETDNPARRYANTVRNDNGTVNGINYQMSPESLKVSFYRINGNTKEAWNPGDSITIRYSTREESSELTIPNSGETINLTLKDVYEILIIPVLEKISEDSSVNIDINGLISFYTTINNQKTLIGSFEIKDAQPDEALKHLITAANIQTSIDNNSMVFDTNGLHLYNGAFNIYKASLNTTNGQPIHDGAELLFKYDSDTESLYIKTNNAQIGNWIVSGGNLQDSNNSIWLAPEGKAITEDTSVIGAEVNTSMVFKAGSNFGVDRSGNLYASGAKISGHIDASSGTIGITTPLDIGDRGLTSDISLADILEPSSALFFDNVADWYDFSNGAGAYANLGFLQQDILKVFYQLRQYLEPVITYLQAPQVFLQIKKENELFSSSSFSAFGVISQSNNSTSRLDSTGLAFLKSNEDDELSLLGGFCCKDIDSPGFINSEGQVKKLLHEGNISSYSIPIYPQSDYDLDDCRDVGLYMFAYGANYPSKDPFGTLLTLPYRKANGNETTDFAGQIFIPNGDDPGYPNSMFFRTSKKGDQVVNGEVTNGWNDWQEVATKTNDNLFSERNIFLNGKFEIKANAETDDSWIKLSNSSNSAYYAFGIRRPYGDYGLQLKYHPDATNDEESRPPASDADPKFGGDIYYDIYHRGNYYKIPIATTELAGLMSAADKTKLDGFGSASEYLLKTGGTISGNLTATNIYSPGVIQVNGTGCFTGQYGTAQRHLLWMNQNKDELNIGSDLPSVAPRTIRLFCSLDGTTHGVFIRTPADAGKIDSEANYKVCFYPSTNSSMLGCKSVKWGHAYFGAINSSAGTFDDSDEREKENIMFLNNPSRTTFSTRDIYSEIFDNLAPVQYNLVGDNKISFGLIAQQVVQIFADLGLDESEIGLISHESWTDSDSEEIKERYGLNYRHFIPLLIHEVQKLKKRVSELENLQFN